MQSQNTPLNAAIKGGILYFIVVFAAAFVLGAVRTRLIAPNFGAIVGVVIELPLILIWAWIACGWAVRKLHVPARPQPRLVMGGIALVLVLVAETVVAVALHQSLERHFADYQSIDTLIGLAAQICFALMPLMRMKLFHQREAAKRPS